MFSILFLEKQQTRYIMVFNITVLQKLQEAGVDLFEIVKNNNEYLLNTFHRLIVHCVSTDEVINSVYMEYFRNIKIQWFNLRRDYILSMSQEYWHELNIHGNYDCDLRDKVKYFTTGQTLEHMFSEERFQPTWLESGEYYNRLLEIQCNFYNQLPHKE